MPYLAKGNACPSGASATQHEPRRQVGCLVGAGCPREIKIWALLLMSPIRPCSSSLWAREGQGTSAGHKLFSYFCYSSAQIVKNRPQSHISNMTLAAKVKVLHGNQQRVSQLQPRERTACCLGTESHYSGSLIWGLEGTSSGPSQCRASSPTETS